MISFVIVCLFFWNRLFYC